MSNIREDNINSTKIDIINSIINISDEKILKKIYSLTQEAKKNEHLSKNEKKDVRKFGFAKGTFTYISDDFDEPLEEFKEYMP